MSKKKVVIAGGGIAGMTAATLLAELGFDVHLYERETELGGKAKSLRTIQGYPLEHSHRLFLKSYTSLLNILERVPCSNDYVINNLKASNGIVIAKEDADSIISLEYKYENIFFLRKLKNLFSLLFNSVKVIFLFFIFPYSMRKNNVSISESLYFLIKHLYFLIICDERRQKILSGISYGDFLNIENKSEAFRKSISNLLSILTAARMETTAECCIDTINHVFFRMSPSLKKFKSLPSIMVMNGPTSEVLFKHWEEYLITLGVKIHFKKNITYFQVKNNKIEHFILEDNSQIKADYFICALPQISILKIMEKSKPKLDQVDKDLEKLNSTSLEWSNSCQFFLKALPKNNSKLFHL
jgi:uncharacterized protein with NAD-binding domain and iron-sulfur cluster